MAKGISVGDGRDAIDAVQRAGAAGEQASRQALATATRYLLQLLEERAPGRSVEVRVPPFGAVQVIDGPRHTRGTPTNVVEMAPLTWIALATGQAVWTEEIEAGAITASGTRADVSGLLPVLF